MKFTVVAMFIAFCAAFGVESKSVEESSEKLTGNFNKRFLTAGGLSDRKNFQLNGAIRFS